MWTDDSSLSWIKAYTFAEIGKGYGIRVIGLYLKRQCGRQVETKARKRHTVLSTVAHGQL